MEAFPTFWLSIFLICLASTSVPLATAKLQPRYTCPVECDCKAQATGNLVSCTSRKLRRIPQHIPPDVIDLDLSNNFIATIDNSSFANLFALKVLSLRQNALRFLDVAAFSDLNGLEVLDIAQNDVLELDARHFYPLENLTTLTISHNPDLKVSINTLQNLIYVKEIYANGTLNSGNYDFSDLTILETLELANCRVRQFQPDNFRSMPILRRLILSGNELSEFPAKILKDLKTLKQLSLSRNFIRSVGNYDFRQNVNLSELDLSRNDIESLEGVNFGVLRQLRILNLNYNKLLSLPSSLFSYPLGNAPIRPILTIEADMNPVVCDCRMKWLTHFPSVSLSCASPSDLSGVEFTSIESAGLLCAPTQIDGISLSHVTTYGDTVTLSCPVTGDPFPSIKWNYHNQSNSVNSPVHDAYLRTSTEGSKINIEQVTFDFAGLYICNAYNDAGSTEVSMSLSVLPVLPSEVLGPMSCQRSYKKPIFLILLLSASVILGVSFSFILYRKYVKAARAQRLMNYSVLQDTEAEDI